MEKLNIDKSFSPYNIVNQKKGECEYIIGGIAILDYMQLFKKFTYVNKESYSLNYIANDVLGEGKLEYEGQINDLWKRDWNKFVEYNVNDVVLVDKIDSDPNKGMRLIELVVNIAYQSLIPFEKVFSPVAIHTGYILRYLKERNLVMPDRQGGQADEELPGAYVFSKAGFFKNVISYDVESMYPHMILTYNISPETLVLNPINIDNLYKTPVEGIYYRKDIEGVLSQVTRKIFAERKQLILKMEICDMILNKYDNDKICKTLNKDKKIVEDLTKEIEQENGNKKYYDAQQQVRKILLNSLYGIMAQKYFTFYNINNAKVITLGGQSLIKYLSDSVNDYFKNYFYKNKKYFKVIDENNKIKDDVVILIDTDSIFLTLHEVFDKLNLKFNDNNEFLEYTNKFSKDFIEPFFEKILKIYADRYGTKQLINFKREKIASKILITTKKRYAVEVLKNKNIIYDTPKLVIKGIEIIRTDTPKFCRDKLLYLLKEIFRTEDKKYIISEMKKIKKEFKNCDIDKIASPTGVSDYDKYDIKNKNGTIQYPNHCPIHNRASLVYNYTIKKYNLNLMPISNGTKLKYIYCYEENELHTYVIGFIGNWPKEFNDKFKINYELQWDKSFQSIIQMFFDVLKWGEINLTNDKLSMFME
jgi:DNA polymerase elongation subunit (family B)